MMILYGGQIAVGDWLHLVRFHCLLGEVKVVEGSEFRDIYDYTCMATGRQPLEVVCIIRNHTFVANHHGHVKSSEFLS